jgi:hypothetical protein
VITYCNIRTFCYTTLWYLICLPHCCITAKPITGITPGSAVTKRRGIQNHGWPTERPTTKNPPLAREWTTVRRWAKYLRRDPHRYSDIVSVPAGLDLTGLLRFDRSAAQSALAAHDKWIPRCCNMCGGSTGVRAHVVKC